MKRDWNGMRSEDEGRINTFGGNEKRDRKSREHARLQGGWLPKAD